MNREKVLQTLDYLKGSLETMDYGKWSALNVEQRNFIRQLCHSWLMLDKISTEQAKIINKAINYIERCRDYHTTYHKEGKIFPDEITSLLMVLEGKFGSD